MNVMRGANLLLYVSGIILFMVSIWHHNNPENFWITFAFYASEAALVGSVADWFAVEALFKKPWGLNIPHTELIHRDREKFIKRTANIIQNELIQISDIKGSLRELDFTMMALKFLNDPKWRATSISYLCSLIVDAGKEVDLKPFAQVISDELRGKLQGEKLAPLVGALAKEAVEDGIISSMVNSILEELIKDPDWEKKIYKLLNQVLGQKNIFFDVKDLASSLTPEWISFLDDLRKEESSIRQLLDVRIKNNVENLNSTQQWRTSIECWKKDVLTNVEFVHFIKDCLDQARESLVISLKDKKEVDTIIGLWLGERLEIFSQNLNANQKKRDIYNKNIRVAIGSFIKEERSLIGEVVTNALSSKSKEDMNAFVMGIAGEDLAWIRRNGTIVGAVVGVVVYLTGYFLIDPFLGPSVRFWFGVDF